MKKFPGIGRLAALETSAAVLATVAIATPATAGTDYALSFYPGWSTYAACNTVKLQYQRDGRYLIIAPCYKIAGAGWTFEYIGK